MSRREWEIKREIGGKLRERMNQPKTGAKLIAEERRRQIEQKGWTAEHDDDHAGFDLCRAAATYCVNTIENQVDCGVLGSHVLAAAADVLWPWDAEWHKPKDPLSNLIRAGALIAAEIDRLQRRRQQEETREHNDYNP